MATRRRELGRLAYPLTGRSYTVGLTGAPGAGKSTLTSALLAHLRAQDEQVAVLAIDPTSPFSGGAILGDRVRMQDHATDPGVFIRSMATRGHLGGLALAVPEAVRLLDAVGRPLVIVETVGVGQVEVEIAGAADTTVVVVNPGWGDAVQANKAGLMEIADVFVINKADRQGVAETRRDLERMLDLSELGEWRPPIVTAVATTGRDRPTCGRRCSVTVRSSDKIAGWSSGGPSRTRPASCAQIVANRLEKRAFELCRRHLRKAASSRLRTRPGP